MFSHRYGDIPEDNSRLVARVESARIIASFAAIAERSDGLLCLDHLRQFMTQLRAILMAMHGDGVLYRRFQKFLLRIG